MKSWRIFFTGVGGQGTLLATRVLGEAALLTDIPVVVSEVHGMAQRGGVVESAVVMGAAQSPVISDGETDILMSFEPLETLRALRKCSSSSLVISNNSPISPFNVASGREHYPDVGEMMRTVSNHVNKLIALDARSLAREAGSELSVNNLPHRRPSIDMRPSKNRNLVPAQNSFRHRDRRTAMARKGPAFSI